ncbi:MAG: 2,4-dihydroxyhept-2-ene-1,7-dioic acid aldolase [Planctomycetes bacterium]|nr:2,4-dihydroxyhept-2-ene-1,7-dioic acid aldolase [Planctomycetota bacterium]
MYPHQLKKKLINRELTIGSWVTIGNQAIIEILASAGFEWLTIDLEHTVIDLEMAQILIAFVQANNMAALVRVSKNEEVIIKRVLDAGANGVIIPMVCSFEDARQAVEFVKYPPIGKRGVGLNRAQKYGIGFDDYKEWLKNDVVIIAQIEHIKGVENIEEIITTDGIDGIIVGPYDLSGSMGYPGDYNRQDVKEALKVVEKACQKHQISLGYHVIEPDHVILKKRIDQGYNFVAFSTDFFFMGQKAREEMNHLKS